MTEFTELFAAYVGQGMGQRVSLGTPELRSRGPDKGGGGGGLCGSNIADN